METITAEERTERAAAIGDLLDEFADKNTVRVVKFEACKRQGRVVLREVYDGLAKVGALPPSLWLADSLRVLAGKQPIYLGEAFRRFGGDLVGVFANGRVNTGIDFCADALGGPAVLMADWIALSNNSAATAATDSSNTLPWSSAQATDGAASTSRGEYTAIGVARKNATYAHTTTVTSYTQSATWTATGAVTSLQMAGMFGGAGKTAQGTATAVDRLFVENTFTATSLANLDQLSLTWTINI
jgi:hypothetical protein